MLATASAIWHVACSTTVERTNSGPPIGEGLDLARKMFDDPNTLEPSLVVGGTARRRHRGAEHYKRQGGAGGATYNKIWPTTVGIATSNELYFHRRALEPVGFRRPVSLDTGR